MKSVYDFYITPEEYEIAELNGICKDALEYRVRSGGWDKDKAIAEPIKDKGEEWLSIKEIALSNGIARKTFTRRRKLGWNIEDSYSIPPLSREECIKRATDIRKKKRVFTDEELKAADNNGINRGTLYSRHKKLKWPREQAISRETLTKSECGKLGATFYRLKIKGLAI
ncbi:MULTISPECIES: hypothetical protein [Bacillus]|uniref:hypothetical protein n=1 Tax=Bacillus TaxID=1386 RepID=UPI0030170DDB